MQQLLTSETKQRVLTALKLNRENFGGSDAKFATSIDVNPAQLSRIFKGDIDQVLSEGKWVSLARMLNIGLRGELPWKTAETPVYRFIAAQLKKCKESSLSLLLCDEADIGKTYTAKQFVKGHKYVVYIDCSQVKSRQKLVRKIAKEYGVNYTGRYVEVYEDLVYYLNAISHNQPLIILDEAGDLQYEAFLELKAMWNATERSCGWFMMGADGLKEKVKRAINAKKVGYTEIFSRYGKRYQKATPDGAEDHKKFTLEQAALVIKANAPQGVDVQKLLRNSEGSLRRIYNELSKLN